MAKRPTASTVRPPVTIHQEPTRETCANCECFLLLDRSTGKGKCRFFPPAIVPEKDIPSIEDTAGNRWPVCWESEWCKQWVHK